MRVIVTSALIEKRFDERKAEYSKSLSALLSFGVAPMIVECFLESGPCFLEKYGEVWYPGVNDPGLRNKGVNEGRAMIQALTKLSGDEQVVKLTGRYLLKSPDFLFRASASESDCVVRYDSCGQVFAGCFSMKRDVMLRMYSSFDYPKMEREMLNVEAKIADYIKKNALREDRVVNIGLSANIFGSGDRNPLTHTEW